jgi:hypothetical protein
MFLDPTEEHKRPICESHPFFHSVPLSPLFCTPLPAPHASATPAPPTSVVLLTAARVGRRPCPPSSVRRPPGPALPWPRPTRPRAPAVGPAPPSSTCRPPGPALPHPAPPCPANRVGGPSLPTPAPPVTAELLFILIFFLD